MMVQGVPAVEQEVKSLSPDALVLGVHPAAPPPGTREGLAPLSVIALSVYHLAYTIVK